MTATDERRWSTKTITLAGAFLLLGLGAVVAFVLHPDEGHPPIPTDLPLYTDRGSEIEGAPLLVDIGDLAPPYDLLTAAPSMTAHLFFFQMGKDEVAGADDAGWYSVQKALDYFEARGFAVTASAPDRYTVANGSTVVVHLYGPPLCGRYEAGEVCEGLVADALEQGQLVYLNGHIETLESLTDTVLSPWLLFHPTTYRLVVLDTCWSCLYTLGPLRRCPGPTASDIVCVVNRTVTGNVTSFFKLMDGLLSAPKALAAGASPPTWASLVDGMNAIALQRAEARIAKDPKLSKKKKEGELYVLSPGTPDVVVIP